LIGLMGAWVGHYVANRFLPPQPFKPRSKG
jgi:hypothetical protein